MEEESPRANWAARNAAYAAAHPVPPQSRVVALALATPVVLLLLVIGWYVVALDADLGSASSPGYQEQQRHQDLVARYGLSVFAGLGCLAAGWLTPRDSPAAWLRTGFACTSVVAVCAAMLAGA
jgi:hypothetical protein